ncbi:MAG: adenylate kinase family protein [Thermofilaceae archaeon]
MSNKREVLPMIILIGGTPGVGKTTVAKRVAESIGGKYINVAELAVKEGLVVGYDAERDAYIIDDARARERLRQAAREGIIIVDTHVASAVPREELYVAVILRLDPRELETRLRSRGYPEWKVLENVQAEVLDACLVEAVELFGAERVFEIDVTGKSVEQIVEEVMAVIKSGKGSKPGSVNWLERLGGEAIKYLANA